MKKFVLLILFIISLISCSLNEDNVPSYHYEILPVDSFIVPDTFDFSATHQIKLYYKLPTICHSYGGIYFDRYLNERTFAIQSLVINENSCLPFDENEDNLREVSLDFKVINTDTYLFKFYKGKDEEGNNIFEEVEVPVNSD
ncbi:MAG TPA: hypothetical protein PLL09_01775 [Flavobacterium sp.]|uniref:hypothetical protein n=2 Tax=Flavobacterium TaxID=237 RepID=UPI0025BE8C13|nr:MULTISPECIES: hypothetical protein [unclassified Flavobacterium]HRE76532.1 hypothetical protein [Flavobacterium sp.]